MQISERASIQLEPFGLADDDAVVVEAERVEVRELLTLVLVGRCRPIEIFHTDQELTAGAPSRQPGDEGRPEVAEVEPAGR